VAVVCYFYRLGEGKEIFAEDAGEDAESAGGRVCKINGLCFPIFSMVTKEREYSPEKDGLCVECGLEALA
jgi:hypothetical protein